MMSERRPPWDRERRNAADFFSASFAAFAGAASPDFSATGSGTTLGAVSAKTTFWAIVVEC
jgi:hypothetical protein